MGIAIPSFRNRSPLSSDALYVQDPPIETDWIPGEDLVSPLANEPRLQRVLLHVLGDLSKPLSAAKAAAIVAVERKHFSKVFLRETGFYFSWWNREIRMRRATELLGRGTLTIHSVALAVGYGNLTTFERCFKKWSGGVPPRAYRSRRSTEPRLRNRMAP